MPKDGPKQETRQALVKSIGKYISEPRTFLTLPAEDALCAKLVKERWPDIKVIGVEYDEATYEKVEAQGIIDWPHQCTLLQFSEGPGAYRTRHVDAAFFDYYQCPSKQAIEETARVLANRNLFHPGKETVLGITFSKAFRGPGVRDEALEELRIYAPRLNDGDPEQTLGNIGVWLKNRTDGHRGDIVWSRELPGTCEYVANRTPMYFILYHLRFRVSN